MLGGGQVGFAEHGHDHGARIPVHHHGVEVDGHVSPSPPLLGRLALGRPLLGRPLLGRPLLGRLSLGRLSLGRLSLGRASPCPPSGRQPH